MAALENLIKRKTAAVSAFTRTFNSLKKLVDSKSAPERVLFETLEELSAKYKVLEESCNNIFEVIDETDNKNAELEKLLS